MDPITLMAGASAAFNGVKALIDNGREIEDVFAQLTKWATYTSDLRAWAQGEEAKPSIFKKLSFGNSTSEALNVMTVRMKLAQQEKDIREMFQWYGPPGAYEEFIHERRRIEAERKRMIYDQMLRRKEFLYNLVMYGSLVILLSLLGFMINTVIQML